MAKKKIIVIGGGFGGVYTIKHLQKNAKLLKNTEITLVSPKNHFLFTPLLHEVATGGLDPSNATIPLRDIFDTKKVQHIKAFATGINFQDKKVYLDIGDELSYDYLVISSGAKTISETELLGYPNVFTLKTLEDALKMKNHFIDYFETYTTGNDPVVVVGGGATGIEIVTELVGYAQQFGLQAKNMFYLITRDTALLFKSPKHVQHKAYQKLTAMGIKVILSTAVTEVRNDGVVLSDGRVLKSKSVIWVPGVSAELDFLPKTAPLSKSLRLNVNPYLQLVGFTDVFCLGDVAEGSPMLAQVAVKQAKIVATNLQNSIDSRPLVEFDYTSSGTLISLGRMNAIGIVGKYMLSGFFAWWVWRTVYLFKMPSTKKKIKIMLDWTLNLFYKRDTTRI